MTDVASTDLIAALASLSESLAELGRTQIAFVLGRCTSDWFDAAIIAVRVKKDRVNAARKRYMEAHSLVEPPLSINELSRLTELKKRVALGDFSETVA